MIGVPARLVPTSVLVFGLDWLTKRWPEATLSLHEPVPLVGQGVRLTLGYNSGVAFGMFANGGLWLAVLNST